MNQPCRRQTAAGRFSGNLMTKVTVYFRTIRSGFNNEALKGKKFQMVHVHDTPERLPFFSLNETTGLGKNEIYIRKGTKCEKATAEEIERIIDKKITTIFKSSSDLSLNENSAK